MTESTPTSSVIHAERERVRALPANVTFRDLIRANRRKSVILMLAMGLLLVALGSALGGGLSIWATGGDLPSLWPSVIVGAVAAAIVAIGASAWSLYGGAGAILRMSGALPLERSDDPQLHNVVEELAIAAGVPMPKVFIIPSAAMNAFATGRDPEHAAVAITTGLRNRLARDELAGVMAHELSHVRHHDIRFAMLMATMVGLIVFACDAFWRIMWYGRWASGSQRGSRRGGKGGAGAVMIVLLVVAVVLAILAPTLAMLIRLAVSRQREYLADAGAVELTRDPQGMISALEKLGACREPLQAANRATSHLYIVNPLKNAMKGRGHEVSSAFRTHPPLRDRIARLRALIE